MIARAGGFARCVSIGAVTFTLFAASGLGLVSVDGVPLSNSSIWDVAFGREVDVQIDTLLLRVAVNPWWARVALVGVMAAGVFTVFRQPGATIVFLAPWWTAVVMIESGFALVSGAGFVVAPILVAAAQCAALFVIAAGRAPDPDVARVFD